MSHKNEVFEIDLSDQLGEGFNVDEDYKNNPGHRKVKIYEPMKNRKITKMWCGLYSYIGMEREEIPPISEWDCERL